MLDAPLVVADEGYGQDETFRLALTERNIAYVAGVCSDTALWRPMSAAPGRRIGAPGSERRPEHRNSEKVGASVDRPPPAAANLYI
jgi:SRSO17 transposase